MPNTIWQSIKNIYNYSSVGELNNAFSSAGDVGQNLLYFLGVGSSIYDISLLVDSTDLTRREKIFPMIGHVLAGVASLAVGIVICAAATLLIPPFIFAGSVANVIRNVGIYFQTRSERKNLQRFYDSDLAEIKINTFDLPETLRKDLKEFIKRKRFSTQEIQDLYVRIGNHFINQTVKEQQALSKLIEELKSPSLSKKEKKSKSKEIKIQEKALKEKFKVKYGDLFQLLEKKERLHFLKKTGWNSLANIGLSTGIAVLSLLTWVVPLSIAATPAAPLAPTVYSALGGLSTGLASVAGINATRGAIKEYQSANKAQKPKEKISKAVFPIMSKSEKKADKKQKQEIPAPSPTIEEQAKKEESHKEFQEIFKRIDVQIFSKFATKKESKKSDTETVEQSVQPESKEMSKTNKPN